ncbi:MAG: GNAT family N-acetyltransferase [Cytophagia bacterium]|nr:MAG: GNAT family N-acetyltransferase [Cytophagia bacterium]TAG43741.1 MAG: GNAT family N-acetyltransferase [Cytophagia bacterium]TAH29095.1 MAG: GNAT family N-acetyltransferase [Cytophagales bacterium]
MTHFSIVLLEKNNSIHVDALSEMVNLLYQKDSSFHTIDAKNIQKTIQFLSENDNMGKIYLFLEDEKIIGYSILIFYWHNEYGGLLLNIDELFVITTHRNKGIGRLFFDFLDKNYTQNIVGYALEVAPDNQKAIDLYTRLGFSIRHNHFLLKPKNSI